MALFLGMVWIWKSQCLIWKINYSLKFVDPRSEFWGSRCSKGSRDIEHIFRFYRVGGDTLSRRLNDNFYSSKSKRDLLVNHNGSRYLGSKGKNAGSKDFCADLQRSGKSNKVSSYANFSGGRARPYMSSEIPWIYHVPFLAHSWSTWEDLE